MRAAVVSTADAPGRFMAANLAWLCTAALAAVSGTAFRPAYALALLVIPVTCGLTRMAAHATRRDFPGLRHYRDGVRHRFWTHLAIGAGQCLVLATAVINIGIGMGGASLLSALVTVVAGYVLLGTAVLAVAVWPLLLDPKRRDARIGALFRLAIAVIMRRPISLLAIAVIEAALFAAIAEVALLGVVVPSFCALIATNFVLPVADRTQVTHRATTPPPAPGDR